MAVVEELLRSESNGTISFGNHQLAQKAKKEDYEHEGDMYKVKTFHAMTKLEKNGLFLYESVPGTSVPWILRQKPLGSLRHLCDLFQFHPHRGLSRQL